MTKPTTMIDIVENVTIADADLVDMGAETAFELARIEGLGFYETIAEYKQAVKRSGDMGYWMSSAYASWYRTDPAITVDMARYANLDQSNKAVFRKMLQLRDYPNWSDEALFQLLRWMIDGGFYTPPAEVE